MKRETLLPTLLKLAREIIGEEDLDFNPDTPLAAIEEWDSLNHVHMVVGMEDVFGIRFTDASKLQGVVRVQDLLDIIADLKQL